MFSQDFADSHIRTLKIVHDLELRVADLERDRKVLLEIIDRTNKLEVRAAAERLGLNSFPTRADFEAAAAYNIPYPLTKAD